MLLSIFVRITWIWVTNNSHGSGVVAVFLHAPSNAVSLALILNLLPAPTHGQMAMSALLLLALFFIFTHGKLSFKEGEVS